MKANRRKTGRIIMLLAVLAFFFMIPMSAYAADKGSYYTESLKKYKFDNWAKGSKKNLKADENTVDLVIDFGAGHEAFVAKWYKAGASSTVAGKFRYSGSKVYVPVEKGSVLRDAMTPVWQAFDESMFGSDDKGVRITGNPPYLRKKSSEFHNMAEAVNDLYSHGDDIVNNGYTLYIMWFKPAKTGVIDLTKPKCGEEFSYESGNYTQTPLMKMTFTGDVAPWSEGGTGGGNDSYVLSQMPGQSYPYESDYFTGKIQGERTYYAYFALTPKYGYYLESKEQVEGFTYKHMLPVRSVFYKDQGGPISGYSVIYAAFKADHDWGAWETVTPATCLEKGEAKRVCKGCGKEETKELPTGGHSWDKGTVTKAATVSATGVKTYTCTVCGETKTATIPKLGTDPKQMGEDGTALGKGASEAAANKAITGMKNDKDPKGSKFGPLKAKSIKQSKKAVKLQWKKVSGAKKYVIYGNACGKSNRMKKIKTTKTNAVAFKKVVKKVKKGKYYKFIVVAIDKNNSVIATSKVVHACTKGGKVGNHKGIKISKKVLAKAQKLKAGKTLALGAKQVPVSKKLKVKKHVAIRYESSNKKVAKVSSKGTITAVKKGSCTVYVYAQNGVAKAVKVVVK